MYNVLNSNGLLRACIHIGHYKHPIGKGICCDFVEQTTSLISQHFYQTPFATNLAISLIASKEFPTCELFCKDGLHSDPKPLRGEALDIVMRKFLILSSISICYNISGRPIDNTISLKMRSAYLVIQDGMFLGQGKDKVYHFKMPKEGPRSGVDFVR